VKKFLGLALALVVGLSFAGVLRADEPREIVDKAIKATGGEEKLAKFKAQTWSAKGKYYGMGEGQDYTADYAVQFPDKFKFTVQGIFTIVYDGSKGWRKMGEDTTEMTAEQLAEQKEGMHAGYLATLLPLRDKAYTLTPLGEAKVGDRAAVGIKVSSKGRRDINLYFDKETNLLIKSEMTTKAEEQGGKEVSQEELYSDHQDVEGVKIPMKMTINRDGKKFVEAESSNVKLVEKLDDNVFSKP
jgi:outer membrane lipoprotein-sorting protein